MRRLNVCFGTPRSRPATVKLFAAATFAKRRMSSGGDTRVAIHARGEAGGFYKIAAPLLNRMVRKNIQKDLDTLKAHLESQR